MSSLAEIDVVIPVGGSARYLAEAILSVQNQVGVVCNPIVVDARSNQHSGPLEVPPGVTLVNAGRPLTAGGARNLGVAFGKHSLLAFLDDDDMWPKERSLHLARALDDSKNLIAVGTIEILMQPGMSSGLERPQSEIPALVAGGILLRRILFEEIGPFDDKLRAGEFIDWLSRAKYLGVPIVEVPHPSLVRRVHRESTTATHPQHRHDYMKVVKRWMSKSI